MDRDMPPIAGGFGGLEGEKSQIDQILAPQQKPPKPCSTLDDLNAIPNTFPLVCCHHKQCNNHKKKYKRNVKEI